MVREAGELSERQIEAVLVAVGSRLADTEDFKRLAFGNVVISPMCDGYAIDEEGVESEVAADAIQDTLRGLLTRPLSFILCEMHDGAVMLTPKGKSGIDISYRDSVISQAANDVSNIDKSYLIRAGEADDLLRALGLMTQQGEIRAAMRAKFRQVNHFIELVSPMLEKAVAEHERVVIVDSGCGKSYLTFVMNYYIRSILKGRCVIYGIDTNAEVIEKSRAVADTLGYRNMEFVAASVEDFRPPQSPDVMMSLHACDLATDQAIAMGINHKASYIFAVPCCQHEIVNQIKCENLKPLTRHRLFKAALADTVTDAIRTLLMEAHGYRVDVIEYVAPDITPKNTMLRAEKIGDANPKALAEYRALRDMMHLTPAIEKMIRL